MTMARKIEDLRKLKRIEQRARWVLANYPPKGERTEAQQKEINDLALGALKILGRIAECPIY